MWACGGSFVACLDTATNAQRLFRGHAGAAVACVAVSPCGRYVASGERAARPVVRIWDAAGCVELAALGPFHRGGVACVAWSGDGRRVVSVGAYYIRGGLPHVRARVRASVRACRGQRCA